MNHCALAGAGRGYRTESNHRHNREDRRSSLDYDDIETADQGQVERFDDPSERSDSRKSNRVGVYSTVHSIQVAKNKAQRRHSKLAGLKDSEASGTQFEGTHYAAYAGGAQVQQIHTHELLTGQGLVPIYQTPNGHHHAGGNIILSGGIGVSGLANAGAHGPPIFLAGGPGGTVLANPHHHHHHAGIALANHPGAQEVIPQPDNDLREDITKSVYVFSAPPDPYDHVPRQTLTKLPQTPRKHYQVLFINAPTPLPPQQHTVELGPPPELKTLVYVLVKKPQAPHPINFIKPQPLQPNKPEVYFIRYKNRGAYGLPPSALGPGVDEGLPVGHTSGLQYAPIAHHQEELRGNVDYGPALPAQYDSPAHPYDLEGYHQDDSHLSASQVLSQRSSAREVDAGVSGI